MRYPRKPWTLEDDAELRHLAERGINRIEVARLLKRLVGAVEGASEYAWHQDGNGDVANERTSWKVVRRFMSQMGSQSRPTRGMLALIRFAPELGHCSAPSLHL